MTQGRATEARSLTYLSICSHAHVSTLGYQLLAAAAYIVQRAVLHLLPRRPRGAVAHTSMAPMAS
jgi:hypothetical protein